MDKARKLNDVYEWLRYKQLISSKKDFASRIGVDKTNLSSAFNGKEKYLTDNLFIKIAETFPDINSSWLLADEGSMLKDPIVNEDNTHQQINDMTINQFMMALAREQEVSREALAQTARLIGVIERMQGISQSETRKSPPLAERE